MRDEVEIQNRRAGDREVVRTVGAVLLVVGGGLLHAGFVQLTGGIPWLALGAGVFALGVTAVSAPDAHWFGAEDPEATSMGSSRDEVR